MADKVKQNKTDTVEEVFEKHRFAALKARFMTNKMKVFVLAIISGFVLIVAGFLLSPASRVRGFLIEGNYFLSDQEILKLSGISDQSRYLFLFDSLTADRLTSSPLIQDADVKVKNDGTVSIRVNEKVILGYHTIINWDKTNTEKVNALIMVDATPEREHGYDNIAKKIYSYPEVEDMYLMSGKSDFVLYFFAIGFSPTLILPKAIHFRQ